MQTTEDISARLRADLGAFIGTENWHRHPLNRSMLLTDGVIYFADQAGAWWFLDIIATEVMRFHPLKPFLSVTLDVREGAADIVVGDGDGVTLFRRHIHFTDAPSGLWRFYLTDNVMLLPGEY